MTRLASLWLVAACGMCAACGRETPEEVQSEAVVPVTVERATIGTIRGTVHATGVVAPAPGAEMIVIAPETARIAEIPKAEGDRVRRGDLLVRFEVPTARADVASKRADVARAVARLGNAKIAQERARDLFERGVAARREVEDADRERVDAEAALAQAEAALRAAEALSSRTVIRATFDGVIAKRAHNPGDLVEPTASDMVLRVIDLERLQVIAAVPIVDVARVAIGAHGKLVGLSRDAPALDLIVTSLPAAVEPGTAAVPVRLAFSRPPPYPAGTPVQVDMEAEEHRNVVTVPASAIVHEGSETAVFVAVDGKAQRRSVVAGLSDGRRVEVVSGVKPGEAVITHGQAGLPDGAAITAASRQ